MNAQRALVAVVDDDESVRESLPVLLKELGYSVRAFDSAESFLASGVLDETGCLVLDVAMPGMSGPELYRELQLRGMKTPVIFITARNDETLRASLLALGAIACLFKPFGEPELCTALAAALPRT